jgi:hypothetical protein
MRKLVAAVLGLAMMLSLTPVRLVAQQVQTDPTKGLVRGTAVFAGGMPMLKFTVKLVDMNDNVVATADTTEPNGTFMMNNVVPSAPNQTYTLKIYDSGNMVGIAGNVVVQASAITEVTVTGTTASRAEAGFFWILAAELLVAGTAIALTEEKPTASAAQ